jgi:hypothetical protein
MRRTRAAIVHMPAPATSASVKSGKSSGQ